MENKKGYYAIIPANVRYDESLTPNAKLLYGEITALCNEKGFCWANNKYFAELYKVSKVSISKWISQLKSSGYVNIEIIYNEGSKEILNRYIRILNDPIKEKLKDNNTLINSTMNNIIDRNRIEKKKLYKLKKKENKIKYRTNVTLKEKEFNKLIEDYGEEQTAIILDKLANYKGSNDKKYKSDYRAILLWVIDAVKAVPITKDDHYGMCEAEVKFHEEQRRINNVPS